MLFSDIWVRVPKKYLEEVPEVRHVQIFCWNDVKRAKADDGPACREMKLLIALAPLSE